MRAAVLRAPGSLAVETLRDPEPGPGEVLLEVVACGVCHSDLHQVKGESPLRLPAVPGHEVAGRVLALGPGVAGPPLGTGVVVPFVLPCGECRWCALGRDDFCERYWSLNRERGTLYDGETRLFAADGSPVWMAATSGFAELAVVPATSVFEAPPGLPLADLAPLGCALFTALGAARHAAALRAGESVAVVGSGGVGMGLVQVAAALGAERVIAVDVEPGKLAAAAELGATDGVDASREDPVEAVRELSGGGVDVAFEALGRPQTIRQALAMLGLGGRAVAIGVTASGGLTEVETNLMVRRQLRLVGAYGARTRTDMPELLRMVAAGELRPEASVSRRVGLDDVEAVFGELDRGEIVGRAIVEIG